MFCSHCGKEVAENILFCPHCGLKLAANEKILKSGSGDSEAITSFVLGLISILLGLTIIIPILGIYFGNKGKNSSKANFAKIGKILSIISLIVIPILIAVCIILSTSSVIMMKIMNRNVVQSENTFNEYNLNQDDNYDWYTSLGVIRARTCDEPPLIIKIDIALGYEKGDEQTKTEIDLRSIEIKDFLRKYFSKKSKSEITDKNEDFFMLEIKNFINDNILSNSKITEVKFLQKDIEN